MVRDKNEVEITKEEFDAKRAENRTIRKFKRKRKMFRRALNSLPIRNAQDRAIQKLIKNAIKKYDKRIAQG